MHCRFIHINLLDAQIQDELNVNRFNIYGVSDFIMGITTIPSFIQTSEKEKYSCQPVKNNQRLFAKNYYTFQPKNSYQSIKTLVSIKFSEKKCWLFKSDLDPESGEAVVVVISCGPQWSCIISKSVHNLNRVTCWSRLVIVIFTARKQSRGKVIFLHMSVIVFTVWGVWCHFLSAPKFPQR